MPNSIQSYSSPGKVSKLKWFMQLFFNIMLIELMLGGGGRFLALGMISVRMIIYSMAILFSCLFIFTKKQIDLRVFYCIAAFMTLSSIAVIMGFINEASIADIFEDIKPLSFFMVLPFFSLCVTTELEVKNIVKLIKICSLILAIGYILLIVFIALGLVNFASFYAWVSPFGEVFFRSGPFFFYKGFIYICIGFFFFIAEKGFWNKMALLILFVALLLTLTRGFILMTLVVSILYFIFIYKNKAISLTLLLMLVVICLCALPFYIDTIGDKADSDKDRYLQIEQVIDRTNILNFTTGDGFGIGVDIRPVHMEISYMEIFSKQGILGLIFWFSILGYIILKYISLYKYVRIMVTLTPFLLGTLFVYLQSATNPYMNNPIGLTMILLTLVVFQNVKNIYNIN